MLQNLVFATDLEGQTLIGDLRIFIPPIKTPFVYHQK
jgi:hypothetical protein